jgi:Coenzyme PQQ synthesis protein D (PqqD)
MAEQVDQSIVVPGHVRHAEDELNHVVVMDTHSGTIYGLDNSAAVIWNALADSGSLAEAVAALTGRYGIDRQQAESDVRDFVAHLVAAGLLAPEVPGE